MPILSMVAEAKRNRGAFRLIYGGCPLEAMALVQELPKADIRKVRSVSRHNPEHRDSLNMIDAALVESRDHRCGPERVPVVSEKRRRTLKVRECLSLEKFIIPTTTGPHSLHDVGEGLKFQIELRRWGYVPAVPRIKTFLRHSARWLQGCWPLATRNVAKRVKPLFLTASRIMGFLALPLSSGGMLGNDDFRGLFARGRIFHLRYPL